MEVGPYSILGPDVEVGAGTSIGPHVVIEGPTRIGEANRIAAFSVLGGPPQDKKYQGEATSLEIGDRNTIREYCTFNRGTEQGGGRTVVGDDNWIMAYVHVAHDCEVGSDVTMANGWYPESMHTSLDANISFMEHHGTTLARNSLTDHEIVPVVAVMKGSMSSVNHPLVPSQRRRVSL